MEKEFSRPGRKAGAGEANDLAFQGFVIFLSLVVTMLRENLLEKSCPRPCGASVR